MARVTGSKGKDLVPRQTRTWIMGDGTTNAALKGSREGRREAESALPTQGLSSSRGGNAAAAWHPAHPNALFQPSLWFPPAAPEGQVWVSPVMPMFLQRGLWGLLESDLAGAPCLPAWQLLPLRPGTSGLKIAVKVTLVYREKNVEVYVLDMKQ